MQSQINISPISFCTLLLIAILTVGTSIPAFSIFNSAKKIPDLEGTILDHGSKDMFNRDIFRNGISSKEFLSVRVESKSQLSRVNETPIPKAVKKQQRQGNEKKLGKKILLIVLSGVFLAFTVISFAGIPLLLDVYSDDGTTGIVPVMVALGIVFGGLFVLSLISLRKVNKETAHLQKVKAPRKRTTDK